MIYSLVCLGLNATMEIDYAVTRGRSSISDNERSGRGERLSSRRIFDRRRLFSYVGTTNDIDLAETRGEGFVRLVQTFRAFSFVYIQIYIFQQLFIVDADLLYETLRRVNIEYITAGDKVSQFLTENLKNKIAVLNNALNKDDTKTAFSLREEHPEWFHGLETNYTSKVSYK